MLELICKWFYILEGDINTEINPRLVMVLILIHDLVTKFQKFSRCSHFVCIFTVGLEALGIFFLTLFTGH